LAGRRHGVELIEHENASQAAAFLQSLEYRPGTVDLNEVKAAAFRPGQ
jgi:hypothetical protein